MNLSLQILFDRPMTQFSYLPSPGGFSLRTKDPKTGIEHVYDIDFCTSQGDVDPNDPCVVGWHLYAPDRTAFPNIDELLQHLMDITAIEDCYVDTEAFPKGEDPCPLQIVSFAFESCSLDDVGARCFYAESNDRVQISYYGNGERCNYALSEAICHTLIYPKLRKIKNACVSFTFEMNVDIEEFDPQFVDKIQLAKKISLEELASQLLNHDISDDLFIIKNTN